MSTSAEVEIPKTSKEFLFWVFFFSLKENRREGERMDIENFLQTIISVLILLIQLAIAEKENK